MDGLTLGTQVFVMLLMAHALTDFPLQGDFLARAKDPFHPLQGISWEICLGAHALINAAGVYVITHSAALAGLEFFAHWNIDYFKCKGWYGFTVDQMLHFACKLIWAVVFHWVR